MPRWIDKILPNLDVEGAALVEELEAKDRAAALEADFTVLESVESAR